MTTVLSGTGLANDLAIIRDASTTMPDVRSAIRRVGLHLAVEVSKHLPSERSFVATPVAQAAVERIAGNVVLVPVLRAGLGLLDAFLDVIPTASVGFVGLRRNEDSLEPIEYYRRIPDSTQNTTFVVIDPMLATGGSMHATLQILESYPHRSIHAACLIAAPEGKHVIEEAHPSVRLVIGAEDEQLNSVGYIVPGLGDAGDRLFGTT